MTGPDPPSAVDHEPARWWCGALATALRDAAIEAGGIAGGITQDWLDDRGREWAERAERVARELVRDAEAAEDLAGALAREAGGPGGSVASSGGPGASGLPGAAQVAAALAAAGALRPGARLGGTEATRVDDERGIRIAQLPDQGADGG